MNWWLCSTTIIIKIIDKQNRIPCLQGIFYSMQFPYTIEQFHFGNKTIKLAVPESAAVQQWYAKSMNSGSNAAFPYWAKLWPSARAICIYLANHTALLKNKQVLELAAGIGLPSMLASAFARKVVCSDAAAAAIPFIEYSASLNNRKNIEAALIDWNNVNDILPADTLLLSDVNYEPLQFKELLSLLMRCLSNGSSIVLSTPQRLMAKPFIEQLLPYCAEKTTIPIKTGLETAEIFIMHLKKQG